MLLGIWYLWGSFNQINKCFSQLWMKQIKQNHMSWSQNIGRHTCYIGIRYWKNDSELKSVECVLTSDKGSRKCCSSHKSWVRFHKNARWPIDGGGELASVETRNHGSKTSFSISLPLEKLSWRWLLSCNGTLTWAWTGADSNINRGGGSRDRGEVLVHQHLVRQA